MKRVLQGVSKEVSLQRRLPRRSLLGIVVKKLYSTLGTYEETWSSHSHFLSRAPKAATSL